MGWKFDDSLKGNDVVPAPEHSLDAAGSARITGLRDLLGAGVTSFSAGDIVLGGAGNDTIEGRGGDDIIDGDKWLNVQLQVPDVSTPAAGDTKLVDSMTEIRRTSSPAGSIRVTSRSSARSRRGPPAPTPRCSPAPAPTTTSRRTSTAR